jgi:hypothetical protein
MEQPFDCVDEIYNQKLREVLDFFMSKLPLYSSSSRLTLLHMLLDISLDHLRLITNFWLETVPLPSRLKIIDSDALAPHSSFSNAGLNSIWNIF